MSKRVKPVIAQLEAPIETSEQAAEVAKANNVPFILDPAPARPLSDELLSMVDVIKPNETEAETITGVKVTDQAKVWIQSPLLRYSVMTHGPKHWGSNLPYPKFSFAIIV